MFAFIKGTVVFKEANAAVLDVSGVGFRVLTSEKSLARIKAGEEVMLHTHLHVREDAMELYGFFEKEELSTFHLLTSVNGVGAKAAVSILSALSVTQLSQAIVFSDAKKIQAAQGVGAKIAQRVILELKDKISNEALTGVADEEDEMPENEYAEAVGALMSLGYSATEAQRAVKKAPAGQSVEETIKNALKNLMK